MAKVLPEIDAALAEWIAAQPLFFVATAPLAADGHVNLSPRGLDTFRVLGPRTVAWLDLTGSGNESAAHLAENGRITVMFCALSGRSRILRLYGRGRVVSPPDAEWTALRPRFGEFPGVRQLIVVEVERVQSSCGFGVPLLEVVGQRDELAAWALKKGEEGLVEYRRRKNAVSIDGLPAPGID